MTRFELGTSCPPDKRANQAAPHPGLVTGAWYRASDRRGRYRGHAELAKKEGPDGLQPLPLEGDSSLLCLGSKALGFQGKRRLLCECT